MNTPLPFQWTGEAMYPTRGFASRADREFVVGEVYRMAPIEERSAKSHAHYFARLNEIWQSLPERFADEFPSADHMRKRALIATGYSDETSFVSASKAEARRLAAFLRPTDEFSVVSVNECVVVRMTAKSQNMRAMGKKMFEKSKADVLSWCEELLGASHGVVFHGEA